MPRRGANLSSGEMQSTEGRITLTENWTGKAQVQRLFSCVAIATYWESYLLSQVLIQSRKTSVKVLFFLFVVYHTALSVPGGAPFLN